MRTTVFSACMLALAACAPSVPIATSPTNNEEIQVDTLFVHDGCTMYRFRDMYTYHYYARCAGQAPEVETMSRVSCGKSCVRSEPIQTLAAP